MCSITQQLRLKSIQSETEVLWKKQITKFWQLCAKIVFVLYISISTSKHFKGILHGLHLEKLWAGLEYRYLKYSFNNYLIYLNIGWQETNVSRYRKVFQYIKRATCFCQSWFIIQTNIFFTVNFVLFKMKVFLIQLDHLAHFHLP